MKTGLNAGEDPNSEYLQELSADSIIDLIRDTMPNGHLLKFTHLDN
jgi:hypothetical protein